MIIIISLDNNNIIIIEYKVPLLQESLNFIFIRSKKVNRCIFMLFFIHDLNFFLRFRLSIVNITNLNYSKFFLKRVAKLITLLVKK